MKKNVLAFLMVAALFFGINSVQVKAQGWTKVFEQTGGSIYLTDLWFVSDNQWQTGWMLSTSSVFKTTDGGTTWTEYTNGLESGCSHVCFVDANIGYISNGFGKVFKSTDGGETWTNVYTSSTNNLGEVAFKDALHGVVAGNQIIYTSDGGATWQVATNTVDCDDMHYAGGNTYYATDGFTKKILKSTDGGQSFAEIAQVSEYIETSAFYDEDYGLVGGTYQVLNMTSDGGQNWAPVVLGDGVDDLFSAGYYDADTIYVAGDPEVFKSVDGGTIWSVDASIAGEHKSMFVTGTNTIYVTSIINFTTMQLWKKEGTLPLVADFVADETVVCESTAIQFTDLSYFNATSWTWAFEGGTPSTSTEQNPTVTYSNPGKFNVTLTVGRDGETASLTKTDYIEIYELPLAPDVPEGDTDICNGFDFEYSVPLDENVSSYIWELSPANAGVLVVNMNEATLEAANTWTGDFTLKVKGANVCGEGPWSGSFEGTLHAVPEAFEMTGGGEFCENSPGVEIG
ncbi:MAG TPA: PKD domain-containing protein, partial [Bacteroidales bacterium]